MNNNINLSNKIIKRNNIVLENEIVKLVFDKGTGSINSLINKSFNKDLLLFKGRTQIFRIVYAIENYRGHHFDSNNQRVCEINILKDKNKQILKISYNKLCSKNGEFHVGVNIIIELEDNSDEVYMSISVKNNDKGQITQIWFPWIRGLTKISDNPENDILAYPGQGGNLISNPMDYFPGKGEHLSYHEWTMKLGKTILAQPYPGRSSMQWMDLGCKDYGIYLACLNKEGYFLLPRVQKHLWDKEEHLSITMVKYPYIDKNGSWESPKYVLSLHNGDWHIGADKYRNWLSTWMIKREKAAWAKNTNGFFHFLLNHQDGTTINYIKDIPEILKEAMEHGINLLFVCGWYIGGHNCIHYPDFEPNQPEQLKNVFKNVHDSGAHLLLYLNMRSYSKSHPDFKKEGYKWASKTFDGLPLTETWGWAIPHYPSFEAVTFGNMCPSARGWQEKFLGKMKRVVNLGADCALFDQLLVVDLCHDTNHGHVSAESSYGPGAIQMLKECLEEGKKINPTFELSMEGLVDIYSPYIAVFHSRVDFTSNSNPEVFRYTLPWVTGITGGLIDMGLIEKVYQSFLIGLPLDIEMHTHNFGRLYFDKELAKEIKRVNMIRDKYKSLFVNGVFKDNIGLEIKDKNITSKVFEGKNSILLTIWNKGKEKAKPKLILNLSKLGLEIKSYNIYFDRGLEKSNPQVLEFKTKKDKIIIDVPIVKGNDIIIVIIEEVDKG